VCWVLGALYVFVPTRKYFNGQGRMWMYRTMWGALAGHFWKYESRFTFFTDQFVSMVTPFRDLDYTICYYYNIVISINKPRSSTPSSL
jgi:EXS family